MKKVEETGGLRSSFFCSMIKRFSVATVSDGLSSDFVELRLHVPLSCSPLPLSGLPGYPGTSPMELPRVPGYGTDPRKVWLCFGTAQVLIRISVGSATTWPATNVRSRGNGQTSHVGITTAGSENWKPLPASLECWILKRPPWYKRSN
eukprot:805677-Rhodomonas_salina.1